MSGIRKATVSASATIAQVFKHLNENKLGIVFAVADGGRVVGCVTDGDIRRHLLENRDLEAPISRFMNRDFVWAPAGTAREKILKLLDHRVHVVPLLDQHGRIVELCHRSGFEPDAEAEVFSRARAPARISFGGGGTDLTHYFFDQGGVVINATIGKFAHAAMRRRSDGQVRIYSHDLRASVESASLAELQFDGVLDLIKSILTLIRPSYGFDLEVSADFPVGSGLGGSAAVAAAVIGCFNEFRSDPWDRHQIAELTFQAERLMLDIPGGWQDQYATVFGGFNYMEFTASANTILPLRLERRILLEIEESIVLCYTGKSHNSGEIHRDQKARMESTPELARIAQRQKDITQEMKRLLLRGELVSYGQLLHQVWLSKRKFSPMISSSSLDRDYHYAIEHGALGGKILGAGGGGYFLFFVPPFERHRLEKALEEIGYTCERVTLDNDGLQSWKMRLTKNAMIAASADEAPAETSGLNNALPQSSDRPGFK
jgi:D-glycero-alpha-D-manno-heptose-7-phosphate kinase